MVSIVNELYSDSADEYLEVTLTHSSGVAITLGSNGSAVMDTPDCVSYFLMTDLTFNEQMTLWVQLAGGNVESIKKLDWQSSDDD